MNHQPAGSRVGRNALVLVAGNLLSRAIGFATYIILARHLGPEQYGVYNIAISYIQIFVLLANFGLDVVYIRDVSRDRSLSSPYFYSAAALKLILSVLSFIALLIIGYILNYDRLLYTAILVCGTGILFQTIVELIATVFKAIEAMEFVSYLMVLRSILAALMIGLLATRQADAIDFLIVQNASFLLVGIAFYILLTRDKIILLKFKIDPRQSLSMLKSAVPFIAIGIIHIINMRTDIIMLSIFTNETLAGYYSAANEFILPLFFLPNMLATALFPAISKHFGKDTAYIARMSNFSSKLLIALGVPMGLGIFLLAPGIVDLMLGAQYAESAVVMRILGIGIMLTYTHSVFSWLLTAINLERFVLREYFLSLAVNVFLNLLLIPRFRIAGAAVATIASGIVGTGYLYFQSRRAIREIVLFRNFVKPLIGAALMGIFLYHLPQMNLFLPVFFGCSIYLVVSILNGLFSKEELESLRTGMKRP